MASEPIIEARAIEKSYPQPDGTRIQVVGLTDFMIEPGKIIALPKREDVNLPVNEQLIVELYSK